MAIPKRIKIERVYVKVASEFDSTGYMQPTSILGGRQNLPYRNRPGLPAGRNRRQRLQWRLFHCPDPRTGEAPVL